MNTITTIIAVVIGLLSIAAGGAKIALVPEEVEFLSQIGFSNTLTISFGIMQTLGGVLLVVPFTRLYGALLAVAGFAVSAILVFVSGNAVFGGVSLLPLLLAGFVACRNFTGRLATDQSGDNA
jgi:hypothetical protein